MGVKQDHHNMALELLRNAPPESEPLSVYDGKAPKNALMPYVACHPTTVRPDGTSITGEQDEAMTRLMLVCVADSAEGLSIVCDRAEAALLGVTPNIAGRSCWPIRDEGDAPPRDWDDTTLVTIWTQRVVYRFGSIPS